MSFEKVIKFTLQHEGGYVNDPDDPGGETKFGISKRTYPDVDIAALTESQAMAIYKRDFWDRLGCDSMAPQIAAVVFDTAVNMGRRRAVRMLQAALNQHGDAGLTFDGLIGPNTLRATAEYGNANEHQAFVVAYAILLMRSARYSMLCDSNATLRKFHRGWMRRVDSLFNFVTEV